MATSLPTIIQATTPLGVREAGETPRLPASARLKEILINTQIASQNLLIFLGSWQGDGYQAVTNTQDAIPFFSYMSFGTPPYENFIRALSSTIHITELNYNIPENSRIVWEVVNNTTTDPVATDIILILEINEE